MGVIEDFINQYNKEFDFYQKLSQIVYSKIEDELFKRGIKAIVSYRAKRPDRLRNKLLKRNGKKSYETVQNIYDDIVDLAGVRVSLYFPSEREIIDEVINDLFTVTETKKFPEKPHEPKVEKRFSGYWATHYRIILKDEKTFARYLGVRAEIQVASVLMHAWSEVEHDLVYKPLSGNLSKEELAILDEINGLVLSGEIALERLQAAISERTNLQTEINDRYDLTNYLLSHLSKEHIEKLKLGDTSVLNNYLITNKTLNVSQFSDYIKKINLDLPESVTDQLLNMLLIEYYDTGKVDLKKYFQNLSVSDQKASSFESFVKCWVVLEKAVRAIYSANQVHSNRYTIPNFDILLEKEILNSKEADQLRQLRKVRNYLLHGLDTPTEDYLNGSFQNLKEIVSKIIEKVPGRTVKSKLKSELAGITSPK